MLALTMSLGIALGAMQSLQVTVLLALLPLIIFIRVLRNVSSFIFELTAFYFFTFSYLVGAVYWIGLGIYRPPVNGIFDAALIWIFVIKVHAGIHLIIYVFLRLAIDFLGLKKNMGQVLALAIGWPVAELFRSFGSWAMPWGLLGYGQIDNPFFKGLYPLVGALGVSGVMWLFAGMSLSLIQVFYSLSLHQQKDLLAQNKKQTIVFLISLILISALAYFAQLIVFTVPTTTKIDVRAVHTQWKNEDKHSPEAQAVALAQLESFSQTNGADVTVFPELLLLMNASQIPQQLRAAIVDNVRTNNSAMIFGSIGSVLLSNDTAGKQNTMLMLDFRGDTHVYAKEILLPFSEHLPDNPLMVWAYSFLYRYPQADFIAGATKQTPFNLNGVLIGTTICSELAYAGKASRQAKDANILINPSSDSWIDSDAYMLQAHVIARVRAAEAQKPLVRPNNVGYSAFIDHKGQVLSQLKDLPGAGVTTMQPRYGNTPYVLFAAWLDGWLNR